LKNKYALLLIIVILFQVVACKKDAKILPLQSSSLQPPPEFTSEELQSYGLGTNLTAAKSLNKSYDYYFDQFDGSQCQSINCGPAVTTMAIKWADSTYTKDPVDARNAIPENGGWWLTTDVPKYLAMNNINSTVVSFTPSNSDDVIKNSIDNNNLVILCVDMYYALYNPVSTQHTNKFYTTNQTGWGHFLLVKGYVEVDGKLYYEIYDPNTDHTTYSDNSPKGKNRYYLDSTISLASNNWWPYAIVVSAKGQQNVASSRLATNSLEKISVASGK
jgi:hypothetical protein